MEDLVIIGGGIVGLSLACAMAPTRQRILVLDQKLPTIKRHSAIDDRVYALTATSQQFLSRIGVFDTLSRVSPFRRMHVWEDKTSIQFDSRDLGAKQLGYIVEHQVMINALLQQLGHYNNVKLQAIDTCEGVTQSPEITLQADGQTYVCQSLIGADGGSSWLRHALGIPTVSWGYQQTAIVARVQLTQGHEHTAWQRFLPSGPLAFLPLSDPHQASIVWSCDDDKVGDLLAVDRKQFSGLVSEQVRDKLGDVDILSSRLSFPLKMQHAKQYVVGNIALVGDACHTVHPLAGQGLNMGLSDVSRLSQLAQPKLTPRQMKKYARQRKTQNWQMILLMEGFKQLFGTSHPLLSNLRQTGFGWCDQSVWLKQQIIRCM